MQTVSQQLANTIANDVSLEIYSRVLAEWELNAYYDPAVSGSASTDPELFPIDTVSLPRRPVAKGIPQLVVGQSRITDDNTYPKFRVPSPTTNYKYYHSAMRSASGGAISGATVAVTYGESAPCNKLVVGFETSFAAPTSVQVQTTANGISWSTAGTFSPNSDGLVELWLQQGGFWSQTPNPNPVNYLNIRGMRIVVNNMSRGNAALAVIQVSPRFIMNLTDRVIDVNISRQREEYELTNPIGTAASGSADITLANDDRLFDRENPESHIGKLVDRNVRFDIADVVVRSDGIHEAVPQGTYFADEWVIGGEGQASVNCTDRSKFMQEAIVENSFYWSKTAEHIVKDIVERFGHPRYDVRYTPADAERTIRYVFFKDEQTVWDALVSLALAEQAAFYFDEQDRFVWESRDWVFTNSVTPALQLRNESFGATLPNLVDWNPRFETGANRVNIKYTPLALASNAGDVVNNVLWEHSESLVLNASPLQQPMTAGSNIIRILPSDHDFWPEEGIVNIDGEYMSYEKSATPGQLNVVKRGLYKSVPRAHNTNPIHNFWTFYTIRRTSSGMVKTVGNSQHGSHLVRDSYVQLDSPGNESAWSTVQYTGGTVSDQYAFYGCELVFPLSLRAGEPYYAGEGVAGLFIHNSGTWDGYFFELVTTQFSTQGDHRKAEIRAWRRNGNSQQFIGDAVADDIFPNTGRLHDILAGQRYRLEVLYRNIDGENHFSVLLNGRGVMSFVDEAPGTKRTNGFWGVFARARTIARFDAAWAIDSIGVDTDIASIMDTVYDRTVGGFNSGTLENAWAQHNRRYADVVYEDFGPIVHGGREFDVDHEIAPSMSSNIFISNDQDTFRVMHEADPFGSKFAIVNKVRDDAVVVGSDPTRDNQQMSLFIYGVPVLEEDENSIVEENTLAMRRRGLEEFELSSPWIQTKERAQRIATWLTQRWGESNDFVEAPCIVTPHLQVGDAVEINAPSENLYPETHRYHIVGITKSVGSQHSMSLTLRRYR